MSFNARILRAMSVRVFGTALLCAAAGCGEASDQELAGELEPVGDEASAASSTFTISCPSSSKATWIQAANGTVDLLVGQTNSHSFGGSFTTLTCFYNSTTVSPRILDHTIQFAPGTVASACGAKASFSGEGKQIGSVPPFGGWKFKSKRVAATATYDQANARCRLQLPVVQPPTAMELKVTKACTAITNGYRCTEGTMPLN